MKQILILTTLVVICMWFTSCSSTKKIEALKPEPSYSNEIVYDKQTSYLNLPVEVSVADLQTQTNK